MFFKRKVYDKIVEWNNSKVKNSALLIEGARRIGKTTIVTEFAKEYYKDNFLYIDFKIASDKLKSIFNDLSNINVFLKNFFLIVKKILALVGLLFLMKYSFVQKQEKQLSI